MMRVGVSVSIPQQTYERVKGYGRGAPSRFACVALQFILSLTDPDEVSPSKAGMWAMRILELVGVENAPLAARIFQLVGAKMEQICAAME